MHHAFISYSRRDSAFVEAVVGELQTAGHEIWIDRRDIPASFPWLAEVREAIAGADLFVEFRSDQQAVSQNCVLESRSAAELGKAMLAVAVGSEPATAAAARIGAELDLMAASGESDLTELLVRARGWDHGGRARSELPARGPTRRMRAAATRASRTVPAVAGQFLRAARRRNRRRRLLGVLGLSVLGISIAMIVSVSTAKKDGEAELEHTEASVVRSYESDREVETDVYDALRRGAGRVAAHEYSFFSINPLREALDVPVPDFSRRVRQHSGAYGLTAESGSGPVHAVLSDHGLEAEGRRTDGRVEVRSYGRLLTRIWVDGGAPTALSFSPDGRLLAVAEGEDVGVYAVGSGNLLEHLRGGLGEVFALRWSADGARVWALAGLDRVLSWPWRTARILLDRPGFEFVGLSPVGREGRLVAVDEEGRLVIVHPHHRTEVVGTQARKLTGTAFYGDEVALDGESGLVVYDLATGRERLRALSDCSLAGAAYSQDGTTLWVGCANTEVRALDAKTLRTTATVPIEGGPMRFTSLPEGKLLVGTGQGHGLIVDGDGNAAVTAYGSPGEAMFAVAASADGQRAVLAGLGAGTPYSAFSGWRDDGGDWHWDVLLLAGAQRFRAVSGAFSDDGRLMALGLASGKIFVYGKGYEIYPGPVFSDLSGAARLSFGGRRLFAATSDGQIAVYDDPCQGCESPQVTGELARRRYWAAVRMGLAAPEHG